jgi:hypothetical protein
MSVVAIKASPIHARGVILPATYHATNPVMAKTGRIKTMDDAPWQAKPICGRGIKVGNPHKMV